jgi:hypothetical protein
MKLQNWHMTKTNTTAQMTGPTSRQRGRPTMTKKTVTFKTETKTVPSRGLSPQRGGRAWYLVIQTTVWGSFDAD